MKRTVCVMLLALAWAAPLCAQSQDEKELRALESRWVDAIVKHDAEVMGKIYATDYIGFTEDGKRITHDQMMAKMRANKNVIENTTLSDERVRIYGDMALFTGTFEFDITPVGKEKSHYIARGMDVFLRRDGRWVCVSSMGSEIVKK